MTQISDTPYAAFLPHVGMDFVLPSRTGFLAIDTETGGFDSRLNPLLSIAMVAATGDLEEIEDLDLKIFPPENTAIEIPAPEHCWTSRDDVPHRIIREYRNVWTGRSVPSVVALKGNYYIITSGAAEINGYVTRSMDGGYPWDLSAPARWHAQGISTAQADAALSQLLAQVYQTKPVPVAHNAPFDSRFVEQWLPQFTAGLGEVPATFRKDVKTTCAWLNTLELFRTYLKIQGQPVRQKGAATLKTLIKTAGADQYLPHDALADARSVLIGLRWLCQQPGVLPGH